LSCVTNPGKTVEQDSRVASQQSERGEVSKETKRQRGRTGGGRPIKQTQKRSPEKPRKYIDSKMRRGSAVGKGKGGCKLAWEHET